MNVVTMWSCELVYGPWLCGLVNLYMVLGYANILEE